MSTPLGVGPQAVRERSGTGRAVGARRHSRTPVSACVSDAAIVMGSAFTSGRTVSGDAGVPGWAGLGPLLSHLPPLSRNYAEETLVGPGLDLRRRPLPDRQHLLVLASGVGAWVAPVPPGEQADGKG